VLPYCSSTDVIEGVVITFLDVTAVKRAKAALRQSEEVHRQAIEAGSVGTWELDPASKELLISAKLAELLGCEAEQQSIPWDQWIEKVHAESRSRVEEALKPSRDDSQPIECTLRIASDPCWPCGLEKSMATPSFDTWKTNYSAQQFPPWMSPAF
jgi:PAS domain-containing protein